MLHTAPRFSKHPMDVGNKGKERKEKGESKRAENNPKKKDRGRKSVNGEGGRRPVEKASNFSERRKGS